MKFKVQDGNCQWNENEKDFENGNLEYRALTDKLLSIFLAAVYSFKRDL